MKKRRRLWAVVDAAGNVYGGAPFDATSRAAAEREVRDTFWKGMKGVVFGDLRVVPLTQALDRKYRCCLGSTRTAAP